MFAELFAAAILLVTNGTFTEATVESNLKLACEFTGGDCPARLPAVYTATLMRPGLQGLYFPGTGLILISDRSKRPDTDSVFWDAVLVHELVHYVVDTQGRFRGAKCANEQLAWAAYNRTVLRAGRPDLLNLGWRKAYPQCQA